MFGRAIGRSKATAPPAAAKNDLAKQLFPSSSPSAQDGNIAQWASSHKGRANLSSGAGLGSSKAAGNDPLKSRSNNIQQQPLQPPPQPRHYKPVSSTSSTPALSNRSSSFASLCSSASAFQDRPEPIHALPSQGQPAMPIFAEDDFSDDDALDLDYKCPTPLPPPSGAPNPRPAPDPASQPPNSQLPWTSSPVEHYHPPANPQKTAQKRLSPDGPGQSVPPVAKKRNLPASWARNYSTEPIRDDAGSKEAPAPRKEGAAAASAARENGDASVWDATQSSIDKRRKQVRSQQHENEFEGDESMDKIRIMAEKYGKRKTKASAISLSTEQQHVMNLVIEQKQSVFFTGPAGTGKSVLVRAIISELKKKWMRDPERLSVTASTGLAACNIGGMTLHSFAGIGLGKEDVTTLVKKIRQNAKAKNRWLRTNTLIIDEVSMVDGELFDKLAQIARTIRNNGRPWGGIQLVITGDFFQLPPVPEGNGKEAKFAFDAGTWSTSIDHTIGLTQVFRQRDPHFALMLNEMRLGKISDGTIQTFEELARPLTFNDGLEVTELFPTRNEVDKSNEARLRNLPGPTFRYGAVDSGEPAVRDRLLSNMMAPKAIDLRKGAQVMLIKNLDETLVNGSLGKVIAFMSESTFDIWSADKEAVDAADAARLTDKIRQFSSEKDVRDVGNRGDLKNGMAAQQFPVIRFTTTDGTHRILLCVPEDWKVELPNGQVQARRKQLPLILAWALSIHKAQGQTLERVKVDLGKVFEKGQAYVALSRAVSKEGLQVLRFDKRKVMAHPRVIVFYNKLYSAESAVQTKKAATIADFAMVKKQLTSLRGGTAADVIDLDEEEAERALAYG